MAHEHTTAAPDGTTIAWSSHGPDHAAPVVLVHGITESAASFDPVVELVGTDRRVITLDLRGHGESASSAGTYDLGSFASDVASVCAAAGVAEPDLVGHSLGGIVVTAAAPLLAPRSVVNVDQSLRLAAFKDQLDPVGELLRDPATFQPAMSQLFTDLAGTTLGHNELDRLAAIRQPDQDVVLGVWNLVLDSEVAELEGLVEAALAPYRDLTTPYLSIFGADPGEGYGEWLGEHIPGAISEVWPDFGHYPHLVDPERFVSRVHEFWENA